VPEIIYTKPYLKKSEKFLKKHPEITQQYIKIFKLLETNPYHPSLRLHKLENKQSETYSVSINITYRITIDFIIEDDNIIILSIGTHEEVH
jgi:mRNA-degrading endonuclease YafQ of YafQ-DinJ toxin-antitoxin module